MKRTTLSIAIEQAEYRHALAQKQLHGCRPPDRRQKALKIPGRLIDGAGSVAAAKKI
jgi:hypothetical protein